LQLLHSTLHASGSDKRTIKRATELTKAMIVHSTLPAVNICIYTSISFEYTSKVR